MLYQSSYGTSLDEDYVIWMNTNRAGLKPMQPMQLHWAPRLLGSRAMVFG